METQSEGCIPCTMLCVFWAVRMVILGSNRFLVLVSSCTLRIFDNAACVLGIFVLRMLVDMFFIDDAVFNDEAVVERFLPVWSGDNACILSNREIAQ